MSLTYSSTSLEKGLRTVFLDAFQAEGSLADKLCYVVDSASNNEKYEWLGESPQMSELKGERHITALSDTGYTLTNTVYTSTIAIRRTDLDDNQTGSIRQRIQQLASTASGHVNKLLITALVDGTSDSGHDSTAFFGNSHTARGSSGTQDNLLGGTGTTASAVATDLNLAMSSLMGFLAENGEPYHGDGPSDLAVVCPPALAKVFREVLGASMISNTSNMQSGMADLIVSPRLTGDANDWYLVNTGGGRKPLIFQQRDPIEFSALETNTESSFLREVYYYGCRSRYAVGYGHWANGIKMVNS